MRNSNSPPSYQGGAQPPMQGPAPPPSGASMMPPPQQQQGMAGLGQGMRGMIDRMQALRAGSSPGAGQPPMPGGPPPGGPPSAQPPISPEGYGAYRKLGTMPITGGNTRRQYNQAAQQFAQQHGSGFDPKGMLSRTKALRRQYGGQK